MPIEPSDVLPLAKQIFASVVAIREGPNEKSILQNLAREAIEAAITFFEIYDQYRK